MPFSLFPYRKIERLMQAQALEPSLSWGFRMAIAAIVPLLWGVATAQQHAASWITLTAECICWVELKGSFGQRMRMLLAGTFLAMMFSIMGSVSGDLLWLSVALMLPVGFLSGLFKNLGDRGSSLALCVYVVFIITNAYPTHDVPQLKDRTVLILTGGLWSFVVSTFVVFFLPAQEPYRRSIALIWRANASLLQSIKKGWDGKALRSSIRDIYLKEKEVRAAIDSSLQLYERRAHEANNLQHEEYQLAQLRKATSLTGTQITALGEELEGIRQNDFSKKITAQLYSTLNALEDALLQMPIFVASLKKDEGLILAQKLSITNKSVAALRELSESDTLQQIKLKRIAQLIERTIRFMEKSLQHLEFMGEDEPVYSSYTMLKTWYILHPKHWLNNSKKLFKLSGPTTRYALRTAIAASFAMLVYKWFSINHGYWLAFTAMIIVQPYFGATFKKALDRILGTITGGFVGGILVHLHTGLHLKELLIFVCSIGMVYFIRKKYAVAAFFITVNLVLLFDVEESVDNSIILMRAICTLGGAAIAIIAGFALLPDWDKKWLPIHLAKAIHSNHDYFIHSFFVPNSHAVWTNNKREAEISNSAAFDSFNRYMQEPGFAKKPYIPFYQIIMRNVHITRALNNIHLEIDTVKKAEPNPTQEQDILIENCELLFAEIINSITVFYKGENKITSSFTPTLSHLALSTHQMFYLNKLHYELTQINKDLTDLNQQFAKGGLKSLASQV